MIPQFVEIGGLWSVLPPGVHEATLEEIEARFTSTSRRDSLLAGFKKAVELLRNAGCRTVYLDGSFVTDKPIPGDFDACWDPTGVDYRKLDPVFLDFSEARRRQKERFGGEFFPASVMADNTHIFLSFFQIDKYSGREKGIIRVCLS